jgi:replicative DNA helicase Mcm
MLDDDKETIIQRWEEFFDKYAYREKIVGAVDSYPDIRSLEVEFNQIDMFDDDLLVYFLERPNKAIIYAEEAMKRLMPPQSINPIHFRVKDVPRPRHINIRDLRSSNLNNFVSVAGLVKKAQEVRPMLVNAMFKCVRCGIEIEEEQDSRHFKEPMECYKDQGGCGRSPATTKFNFLSEESDFIDVQMLEIQEMPEGLRGGEVAQSLPGRAFDDISGMVTPGDSVVINGVLKGYHRGRTTKLTVFDIYMDINSIETKEKEFEALEITPEDEEMIRELAKDSNIIQNIRSSIAPTIYGMEIEKEALALQLFSGVRKIMPDGTKIRGDIHILLIGDPGTAKSQLLRYIGGLAPRGIYASGKSASAAGLTAAAVRDEFGDGRWTLEAGALVLADLGMACIDELDKMEKEDRSSMHEAMEQQSITVAKAGINSTLQCRCSILGAANPKFGRFETTMNYVEQINMPPALLSRFDIIFPITDKPNADRDARISEHVLKVHLGGEIKKQIDKGIEGADPELLRSSLEVVDPPIEPELFRKYIAYARNNIFPAMTSEAKDKLKEYYVNVRRSGGEGEDARVSITVRQLEAFVRLAEASAKARLSNKIEPEDADRAIKIVKYYLESSAQESGHLDIDIITTGHSRSQRDQMVIVRDVIKTLAAKSEKGANMEGLLTEAESRGIEKDKLQTILTRLKRERNRGASGGMR